MGVVGVLRMRVVGVLRMRVVGVLKMRLVKLLQKGVVVLQVLRGSIVKPNKLGYFADGDGAA